MKHLSSLLPLALLFLALSALLLAGCHTPRDEWLATPWIRTKQRLTLLSANDGQAHLKLDPAHMTSNLALKLDRNFTRDSITVVHLGPDHPPIVKTVYDMVPNTIGQVPYAAFSRDGRRVLAPNGRGAGSKGRLDDVLVIDMTLNPPEVTEVIPQVADGIESLAFHPSGRFAVITCLEELPPLALDTYSHLAVIDLTSKPPRLLYHINVEPVPEGIEFTPDGTQLFVQCTSANHIAVFDVDGFRLKRSPYVIRVGHGPASMALGRRFNK